MIVLDTNVLSELMRPEPNARVVEWLDRQNTSAVAVTAITVAEILHGIERLPKGRRQRSLALLAADLFESEFPGRILPFDVDSAAHYAEQLARSEAAGRQVHTADAQIAAICCQHEARLATRNVRDFEPMAVQLIDPWQTV